MGEIADMMIEGILCQCCGAYLDNGGGSGFPESCEDCSDDEQLTPKKPKIKVGPSEKRRRKKVKDYITTNFSKYPKDENWGDVWQSALYPELKKKMKQKGGCEFLDLAIHNFYSEYLRQDKVTQDDFEIAF